MRNSRANGSLLWFVLAIWAVSSLYYLSYYRYGLNLWDEGVPLHGALRTLAGDFVYRDFYGYQPGIYLLYALSYKLFGVTISAPRLLMAWLGGLLPALTFFCVARVASAAAAILPTLAALVAPCCYYNRMFPVLSILSLALIVNYYHRPSVVRIFWIFLGGLTAYYLTIEIGVAVLLLGLVIAFESLIMKRTLRAGLGMLLGLMVISGGVCAPLIIYYEELKLDWVLSYTWHLLFNIRAGWSNPIPTYWNPESLSLSTLGIVIEATWFWVPIAMYLVAAGSLLWLHYKQDLPFFERRVVMITTLWGLYIYYLVFWRAGWGNLLRCLHPTYVLVGWGSWRLWRLAQASSPWGKRLKLASLGLLCCPLLGFIGYLLVEGDESAGAMAMCMADYERLTLDRVDVYCEPEIVELATEITRFVSSRLTDSAELVTIPLNPLFNFLTGNLSRSYHEWIIPGTFRDRLEEREFVKQLDGRKVPMIIYRDIAIDGRAERRIKAYAPNLFHFLVHRYHLVKRLGNFMVLEPNANRLALDLITWCTLTENYQVSGLARLESFGEEELDRAIVLKGESVVTIDIPVEHPFQFTTEVWTASALPADAVWVTAECGNYQISGSVREYDQFGLATLTLTGVGPLERLSFHVRPSEEEPERKASQCMVWWLEPILTLLPAAS